MPLTFILIGLVTFSFLHAEERVQHSQLWGVSGEKWDRNRIPDFTKAGYREGKVAIPIYENKIDIKKLGAIGNGIADDTRFFFEALETCKDGKTLFIPAGVYKISKRLYVVGDRCTIVGAGEKRTTLFFTKGLEELDPQFTDGQTFWSWSGGLISFDGASDSGIENLSIQFPDEPWAGHDFHERGYNAVGFDDGTNNCWLRNLTITGPDMGIWIAEGASHITADHWTIQFGPKRARQDQSCHHAVNIYGGHNLLSNFQIDGICRHDLSVESENSRFNVFSNGKGKNLSFDHHSQDYEQRHNLFTEIDIGLGTRMYESGGNQRPQGVSFYEVWWNIKSVQTVPWVTSKGISKGNVIVGINAKDPSALNDEYGNWLEAIPAEAIQPANLYKAQVEFVRSPRP